MDDIDAGVDSVADAKNIIKSIDLTLQTRQLRLNSGKTMIMTSAEARRHFRTLENGFLKRLEADLGKSSPERLSAHLSRILPRWQRRRVFEAGNGEKILKRILSLSIRFKANLDKEIVISSIKLRPNIRTSALRYLAHHGVGSVELKQIRIILEEGYICDDAFYMELGRHLFTANIIDDDEFQFEVAKLIHQIGGDGFYRLYTSLLLSSRFRPFGDTLALITQTLPEWAYDFHLGRLVAGMAPLALKAKKYPEFAALVKSSGNSEALNVLNFHYSLRADKIPKRVLDKTRKQDTSFPCGVRFGKWIVLHSILENKNLDAKVRRRITKEFASLAHAPYFGVPGI